MFKDERVPDFSGIPDFSRNNINSPVQANWLSVQKIVLSPDRLSLPFFQNGGRFEMMIAKSNTTSEKSRKESTTWTLTSENQEMFSKIWIKFRLTIDIISVSRTYFPAM